MRGFLCGADILRSNPINVRVAAEMKTGPRGLQPGDRCINYFHVHLVILWEEDELFS